MPGWKLLCSSKAREKLNTLTFAQPASQPDGQWDGCGHLLCAPRPATESSLRGLNSFAGRAKSRVQLAGWLIFYLSPPFGQPVGLVRKLPVCLRLLKRAARFSRSLGLNVSISNDRLARERTGPGARKASQSDSWTDRQTDRQTGGRIELAGQQVCAMNEVLVGHATRRWGRAGRVLFTRRALFGGRHAAALQCTVRGPPKELERTRTRPPPPPSNTMEETRRMFFCAPTITSSQSLPNSESLQNGPRRSRPAKVAKTRPAGAKVADPWRARANNGAQVAQGQGPPKLRANGARSGRRRRRRTTILCQLLAVCGLTFVARPTELIIDATPFDSSPSFCSIPSAKLGPANLHIPGEMRVQLIGLELLIGGDGAA